MLPLAMGGAVGGGVNLLLLFGEMILGISQPTTVEIEMNFKNLLLPPVIWTLSIVTIVALHKFAPIQHFEPTSWRTTTSLIILILAIATTAWHKRLFKIKGTNINTFGKPDKLVESGLFQWTRNPMYLSFTASLAALALLSGAASAWLVVIIFFVLSDRWYIPYEEREMQAQFGDRYRDYCSRTRRWI